MSDDALGPLEDRIGHRFTDVRLLRRALSHRSFVAEHAGNVSNERLEFLGDAVLGMVVTDRIFRDYPDLPEGELAKVRATLVSAETLADVARELGLGDHVLLGRGEEQSGGREKPSILADALEAVFGAVYLDRDLVVASALILRVLGPRIGEAAEGPGIHDHKTRLQELAVRLLDEPPRYVIRDEGPDHAKQFHAMVTLRGEPRGSGTGTSKKQAEQEAAAEAWEWLRAQIPEGDEPDLAGSERDAPGHDARSHDAIAERPDTHADVGKGVDA